MAKYNWIKYKKNKKKKNNWEINPCGEILLDAHINAPYCRLETDTISIGEVGQATALTRPGRFEPFIQGDTSTGIEPTFSHVYRGRDESFSNLVSRLQGYIGRPNNPAVREAIAATVNDEFAQRIYPERTQSIGNDSGLVAGELRVPIRTRNSSVINSEET